jgi:hypothetical protein
MGIMERKGGGYGCVTISLLGIHLKRDNRWSIAYSEELIVAMSATLQSTDRHYGIVGQERCHYQRDS